MQPHRTHFTYANVTATLALVVVLGVGTSYAATQLPKNSVGSKQIKTSAVKSAEIKNKTVAVNDLKPTTVADLKAPRAYGVFNSAGTLVPARSKNVTVDDLAGSGNFCVTPTAASGIDATKTSIVATPDYTDGPGIAHIVQTVDATLANQTSGCPNGFHVFTSTYVSGPDNFAAADIAVSFVIP